jgi:hypothetical protein
MMVVAAALYSHGRLFLAKSAGPDANAAKLLPAHARRTAKSHQVMTHPVCPCLPYACSRMMDVTAALYSHGTLLLAESSGPDANATKLLLAARNYTLPPPSINTNTTSQSVWLREVVSELSQLVPGKATPRMKPATLFQPLQRCCR